MRGNSLQTSCGTLPPFTWTLPPDDLETAGELKACMKPQKVRLAVKKKKIIHLKAF